VRAFLFSFPCLLSSASSASSAVRGGLLWRSLASLAVTAVVFIGAAATCAAAYPERPVRLVVPVAPGGAVDVVGRMLGQKLSVLLGHNVVIDNRAGANYIKSAGPAINELLAGHIPLMFGPSPVVVPMVQAGRLRPLAFTGLKRSPQLPDLPTADELGIKGYEATGWYGLHGPRGLPKAVVQRLNEAARQFVQMPDTRERFAALNLEPVGSSPEEFARFLREDLQKYARIAKMAGIQPQ